MLTLFALCDCTGSMSATKCSSHSSAFSFGTFSGGGINGWRRPCLKILRQLWAKVCKVQAKVRRLDAAPGDVFADACKKDEAVKRFLPLDVAAGTTLRDALASISQKKCYVRWRHVEALVFGELGAPNASFHSQVDEVYRRGPLDLLRFDSSSTAPHDETAADLALQSDAKTKSVLLEVVTDPRHGLVFALSSDGVLDAWDMQSTKRIGKAPFLCVAPEPSQGEDVRPLPRKLAARMLAMAPRTLLVLAACIPLSSAKYSLFHAVDDQSVVCPVLQKPNAEIGRASCRERV